MLSINFFRRFLTVILVVLLIPALVTQATADPEHGSFAFVEVNYGEIETYQASAVELSPDGDFLYLGAAGGAITVFRRNHDTGRLVLVQYIQDEHFGLGLGLYGLDDMVISPDGNYLYTCAYHADMLITFSRNPTSGTLTYQDNLVDGAGGVDGLDGCASLAITPDGKYVYAAGSEDDAIARFSRNSITGLLTFLNPAVFDGIGPVTALSNVYGLTISPDSRHLYAAAYGDSAVTSFSINNTTGELLYVNHLTDSDSGVDGLSGARGINISPDGKHVYVTSWNDESVATFNRNLASGALTFVEIDIYTDWLAGSYDVVVSPDGNHVYVCSYGDNAVVVFTRNATNGRLDFLQVRADNTIHAEGLEGAKQLALSPDGSFLYVASRIEGAMPILRRNPGTGLLTYVHTEEELSHALGPVGVAVSPDGKNVYIANNLSGTLTVTARNPISGKLRELETFWDNHDGVNGLDGARAVEVSPDGNHVYVAGHNDNAIAIFVRNPADGTLTYSNVIQDADLVFGGLIGIHSLALSPLGGYLYAVSTGDDALVVFVRNQTTGNLTHDSTLYDGVGGVDGLNDAYHIAISSDGGDVYVAGYSDDSLTHFEWQKLSGLTHIYTFKDSQPGIDGLDGANSVVISPDGSRLYVASRIDSAVAMFIRGTSTGNLGYHSMVKDGVGGVDGLWGARAITMNASGTYVYVASQYDDAVAVFARDTTYGDLTYFTAIKDSEPGIDGLNTANGIAISPTFNHIYITSYDDDAVSVFNHFWSIYTPLMTRD